MTDVISMTRRGLMIGGSAVAGAVAATPSAKRALAQGGPTERLAYVGCYTPPGEGIVLYRVNADTGAMTHVKGQFSGISNPSWIALDPLHRVLYAVNEDEPSGGVSAFTVDHASGDLKLINKVDSHGKWPCHLSVHPSGKFVLVANYGTGNVPVFPILANGGLGDPTRYGERPHGRAEPAQSGRQILPAISRPAPISGPKMHMIETDRFRAVQVIANDAGLEQDADLDAGSAQTPASSRRRPSPSVPSTPKKKKKKRRATLRSCRTDAFSTIRASRTVSSPSRTSIRKTGAMKEKQSISVLPKRFGGSNLCSELAVSPDGRFVYGLRAGTTPSPGSRWRRRRRPTWASEAWSHADYPRSFRD